MDFEWPTTLTINAYTGTGQANGIVSDAAKRWVLTNAPETVRTFLKPPPEADPNDWHDPRVGWGLVLPEKPGQSNSDLKSGDDAPEPIRQLLKQRSQDLGFPVPVLRYRPESENRYRFLRNYRDEKDIAISGSPPGVMPGCLPRYLLIFASPTEIPWELQYLLNASCAVGRLALDGQALENYVGAMMDDWKDTMANPANAVVWATDHGPSDITRLMRNSIAAKVYNRLAADPQIGTNAVFVDGSSTNASGDALTSALALASPGLVVTTSHGQTGPLDNLELMGSQLGLPVDQNFLPINPHNLLDKWSPNGAIWYAHACCSAGSDSRTLFNGLVDSGSEIDRVLNGIAMLGARIAPLPQMLLGGSKPLRAFVGHVEPTFDWTLRQPPTGQHLTDTIITALYEKLFQPDRIGNAFRDHYGRLGALYVSYEASLRAFNSGENTRPAMLHALLSARDVQSMVILGDPTACLPALP
ncbi:hypothetical protein IVG45_10725 [Methylomonas sp. LL1]|uniref:hypothetical protein n=1 Tax=Methylomonas sp. LL1 TaxID=2785785 RepID=UPI0018C39E6E|nr:hypothetical protein [Methylomonas sp. LL1]QPK65364.1 hypothetical protein IVG45_10725 [Methylomonas sp. LL1]